MPIHIVHGDQDDFAPVTAAHALASELSDKPNVSFTLVPDANHFLNEGPPELVLQFLETAIASVRPQPLSQPRLVQRLRAFGVRMRSRLAGLARQPVPPSI